MKKLTATIGKIVFYIFVLAVAAWTASLTLSEMKAILPNDQLTPYFALALFDGGCLAWLAAWTGHARGLMQRSISVIMLLLDLLGVVLLSAGRLLGGGQTMIEIPQALAQAVIYGVIGATLCNLAAVYLFHVTDPAIMEAIETGILEDTLHAEAMRQAQHNIEIQAQQLGAVLAARATGQLKYRLALPMGEDEAQAVITTKETTQQPSPRPGIVSQWLAKAANTLRQSIETAPAPAMNTYQAATTLPILEEAAELNPNPTQPETGQPTTQQIEAKGR